MREDSRVAIERAADTLAYSLQMIRAVRLVERLRVVDQYHARG